MPFDIASSVPLPAKSSLCIRVRLEDRWSMAMPEGKGNRKYIYILNRPCQRPRSLCMQCIISVYIDTVMVSTKCSTRGFLTKEESVQISHKFEISNNLPCPKTKAMPGTNGGSYGASLQSESNSAVKCNGRHSRMKATSIYIYIYIYINTQV